MDTYGYIYRYIWIHIQIHMDTYGYKWIHRLNTYADTQILIDTYGYINLIHTQIHIDIYIYIDRSGYIQILIDTHRYAQIRIDMQIHGYIDQWEFQDPKMEVRQYHISGHMLGIFAYTGLKNRPNIYGIGSSNQSVPES